MYKTNEPTPSAAERETSELAGVLSRRRQKGLVLIVEDDFVFRSALAARLGAEGYDVESAADGLEAFMTLDSSARKPVVILLDISMPRMDGVRFRALQASLPLVANIPVIAITGDTSRRSGFDHRKFHDTFFKPLDLERLLRTIRDLPENS